MRKCFSLITLFAIIFCGIPQSITFAKEKRSQKVKLMEIGSFHGEEISASTGEQWLGLYVSQVKSSLSYYPIKIESVFDPIMDSETKGKTGKRVDVNLSKKPLFLVYGTSLLPSKVDTVFYGEKELWNGTDFTLKLGEKDYRIRVTSNSPDFEKTLLNGDSKLIISTNEKEQTLYSLNSTENHVEAYWQLLWAGDIDHDNELDLYIRVNRHYNSTIKKLFLSSKAKQKNIVEEIAEFVTVGC